MEKSIDKLRGSDIDIEQIKYNVICFGYLPWSHLWKRNQSMMAQIALFTYVNKVIFINPVDSLRNPARAGRSWQSSMPKDVNANFTFLNRDNFKLYSPYRFLPLKNHFNLLEKIENKLFFSIIKLINGNHPYVLYINDPIKSPVLAIDWLLKEASLSIFDFSDDFIEYFKPDAYEKRKKCLANINQLASKVDIVLTVNQHLKKKYSYTNDCIEVLTNATNFDNFDRNSFETINFLEDVKKLGSQIAGYIGGIRENRIDFNLLDNLLAEKDDWQFVFIGDADTSFRNQYASTHNVHLFPSVDYQCLPDCLNYFDLAVIPFKYNEHTKGNDLLKIYDFLAMGKPIVSSDLDVSDEVRDVLYVAEDSDSFLTNMDIAIRENNKENIELRKSVAMKNSWPTRITSLEEMMIKSLTSPTKKHCKTS